MIGPGATLGVLGGGQLGRMFAMRAMSMGYRVVVLDPDPVSPAGQIADHQIRAAYDDADALSELSELCAAVTIEFENVPAESMRRLASQGPVAPPPRAVTITQDRIAEKSFLRDAGFATAPFHPVSGPGEIRAAVEAIGTPAILKTSRLGYDGKGQALVGTEDDATAAFERFRRVPCILERRLALETELSVVLARGRDGTVVACPVGENRHERGILDVTIVPARVPEALAAEARDLAGRVAAEMDYVGVLGVELFVADGGRLYVNEMAPRPHNSGHYTMDACLPDQFELQVRTLCDLPLVEPTLLTPVAMANLLGDLWADGEPRWSSALSMPGVRLHLYGKAEARPGRKMGHLNCVAGSAQEALDLALAARASLMPPT